MRKPLLSMRIQRGCCFILLVCLCVGLLAACQPTPAQDAVKQKNYDKMLQKAEKESGGEAVPLREQTQAPERYTRQITGVDGAFVMDIDADVEIPDHVKMPIAEIVPVDFSQEQTKMFFDLFCKDREMYIRFPNAPQTRDSIEGMIQFLVREIAEMEEKGKGDDSYTEQCRSDLAYYQSIYADAPESNEPVRCYGELMTETEYSPQTHTPVCRYTMVWAQEETTLPDGDLRIVGFSVINRNDLEHATQVEGEWFFKRSAAILFFTDQRNLALGDRCPRRRIKDLNEAVDVPFSPRQAEAAAMEFLRSVGLERQIGIDSVWLYRTPENDPNYQGEPQYSYEIRLSRIVEDIPCAYDRMSVYSEYMDPWQYEQLALGLDAEGVFDFRWFGPVQVTQVVQEDVNLLPFEQIMERFEAQVNYELVPLMQGYAETGEILSQHYVINRITLSLQRIGQPNNFDSAMLVPVWSFYGTFSEIWSQENSPANVVDRELDASLFTINAIDGTLIHLQDGY